MSEFDKLFGADFRNSRDVEALKQAILDDKKELIRLRNAIEENIQNLHDQIEVAKQEDYADIDDYCMELRTEELLKLLGKEPEKDKVWEQVKQENWKQIVDLIISGFDKETVKKGRILSIAMKQLRGTVSGEEVDRYLNEVL
mgnify:FL=1